MLCIIDGRCRSAHYGPSCRRAAPTSPRPNRPYALWALLVLTVVAGVGVIAFPTLYIMPFKTQDDRLLTWALTARTHAPTVTLVAAVVALMLAVLTMLRLRRWWTRALPLLLVAPVLLGAWFARQNHFEWMFTPQTTSRTSMGPGHLRPVRRPGDGRRARRRRHRLSRSARSPITTSSRTLVAGEPIVATY